MTAIQLAGYLSGWDVADAFRASIRDIPVSRRRRAHPFHLFDRTDPRLDRAFGTHDRAEQDGLARQQA